MPPSHPEPSLLRLASSRERSRQNADLKALEVEPQGDLRWRISAISARWLVAGREIMEEYPNVTQSDEIAWKIRVAGLAVYSAAQVCGCTVGIFFSLMAGYTLTLVLAIAHIVVVGLVLICTHIANRTRRVGLLRTVDMAVITLVGVCLFGTTFLWPLTSTFRGWHWSVGVIVWQWACATGPIPLLKDPVRSGIAIFAIVVGINSLLIVSSRLWGGTGHYRILEIDEDTFGYAILSGATTYALVPVLLAVLFRRACLEYRWRLDAVRRQQQRLDAFRASSRFLIFSLIPPIRATKLAHSSPALWHRGTLDTWEHCTLVQMDVSGFTAMSSKIQSEELVDLINALFTSVEYAAECIGNIWMVELIGDCGKFIVGGPYPCDDHQYRAAVLAYSIVEVFGRVATRLNVNLTVRVGVHSGPVVGAVVGSAMPRYLLHGRACEVLGKLEASAPVGGVMISEPTAAALGESWPHDDAEELALTDGTRITGHVCRDRAATERRMGGARMLFPALGKLLTGFEEEVLAEDSINGGRTSLGLDEAGSGEGSGEPGAPHRELTRSPRSVRLAQGIRGFSKRASILSFREGGCLTDVAKGRAEVGLKSIAFGAPLERQGTRSKSLAYGAESRSVSAGSIASSRRHHSFMAGGRPPSRPSSTATPSTVDADFAASFSLFEHTAAPKPVDAPSPGLSKPSALRTQAVLVIAEEEPQQARAEPSPPAPPPAPSAPISPGDDTVLRDAWARSKGGVHFGGTKRGSQDGPSGLRALPDGCPPTRLLAPVQEDTAITVREWSDGGGLSSPRSSVAAHEERGGASGGLEMWHADLILAGEEELPVGATLDLAPAEAVRPEMRWESQPDGAMPIEFQRSIVNLFITVLTAVCALHTVFLAVLHATAQIDLYLWDARPVRHLVVVLPALLLLLLVACILASRCWALDWQSGHPQFVATLLVFFAPFALEGSVTGRSSTSAAILWAGAAVLIPCSTNSMQSVRWWVWMAGYWAVCLFLIGWQEKNVPGGAEPLSSTVVWWRDVLVALHLWGFGALMMGTLGLASKQVAREQDHARALFHKTKLEAFLEGKLLNALVPAEVRERFLRGDTLIADRIQDGTVMFIYINGYQKTLLEHGTPATILWINRVFNAFDACISNRSSIIKVETFNDFLLVYSKERASHLDECVSLAIDMLDSIRLVLRPDGAPTTVKLGASSGDFTAGIIGSSAPRYSIFGDTVNTASRMASNSRPCTLTSFYMHLSDTAKGHLGEALQRWLLANLTLSVVERGQGMEIKGKGWMQTFCLSKNVMADAS